jgi:TusA-related sulfurtransferase
MELIAALKTRNIGDQIEIWSSDKGSAIDIPEWCKKVRHECVSVSEEQGYWSVLVRKAK